MVGSTKRPSGPGALTLTPQTANIALSRLLNEASVKNKGLQIADSLTDEQKKISLKTDEVIDLLSHVDGLPEEKKA
ncbi:MAG TPA: hypothetical protein VGO62_19935, partial [Myxococcota bacterium]